MTTPERGLFEQIRGLLPITGCFTNIEKICVEHEQRLAEAEKELAARQIWENAHSIAALEQRLLEAEKERDRMLNIIGAKEDERMEAHRQATQLRARCGELERKSAEAYAFLWSVKPGEYPPDHAHLFLDPHISIVEARKILLELLTVDQRSMAIANLRNKLSGGTYFAAPQPAQEQTTK